MKRRIILFLSAAFIYITLTSKSAGIAYMNGENRTGAGGSSDNCAGSGCHDPNGGNMSISIILLNKAHGDTVKNGKYTPGGLYTVLLHASQFVSSNYTKYSFQFTAGHNNGTGAGIFLPATGLRRIVVGPYEIVEPENPLNGTTQYTFIKTFDWKAPLFPNQGDVIFYATVLLSDNNGFVTGDMTYNQTRTIAEGPLAVRDFDEMASLKIFPNPFVKDMNLSLERAEPGKYDVSVFDLNGRMLVQKLFIVSSTSWNASLDMSGLYTGNYLLVINHKETSKVLPVIKTE